MERKKKTIMTLIIENGSIFEEQFDNAMKWDSPASVKIMREKSKK